MALVTLPRPLIVDINGTPRVAARMYLYDAGTSNAHIAYTSKSYTIEHSQPILSAEGGIFPVVEVNPEQGNYKIVLQDEDGSEIYSADELVPGVDTLTSQNVGQAINPRTSTEAFAGITPVDYSKDTGDVRRYVNGAAEQGRSWYCYGHPPTYIDATHFSVPGNQTSRYLVGQRVRSLSGGGISADFRILSTTFSSGVTTVTVFNDTGSGAPLPNPIAAVSVQISPDATALSNITYDNNVVTSGLTVANRNQGSVAVGRISAASLDPATGSALAHIVMVAVPPSYTGAYLVDGPSSGSRATIYSQVTSSLDIGTSDVSRITIDANGGATIVKTDLTVNNGNGTASTSTLTINALTTSRLALNVNSAEKGFVGATATEVLVGTNAAVPVSIVTNGLRRLTMPSGGLGDYADDTAAASGGVAVGSMYRTGSALKVRVA